VTLFDAGDTIGGQFNLAKQVLGQGRGVMRRCVTTPYLLPTHHLPTHQVPGKEEFHETLRYFKSELRLSGVTVQAKRTITLTLTPTQTLTLTLTLTLALTPTQTLTLTLTLTLTR